MAYTLQYSGEDVLTQELRAETPCAVLLAGTDTTTRQAPTITRRADVPRHHPSLVSATLRQTGAHGLGAASGVSQITE
jgi:hypothetical protein